MTTTVKISDTTLDRIRLRQKKNETRNNTISRILDLKTFHEIKKGDIIGFDTYKNDRSKKSGHYACKVTETKMDEIVLESEPNKPDLSLKIKRAVRNEDDKKIILSENDEPSNFIKNLETSSRFI